MVFQVPAPEDPTYFVVELNPSPVELKQYEVDLAAWTADRKKDGAGDKPPARPKKPVASHFQIPHMQFLTIDQVNTIDDGELGDLTEFFTAIDPLFGVRVKALQGGQLAAMMSAWRDDSEISLGE